MREGLVSRRAFLRSAAVTAGAAVWAPAFRIYANEDAVCAMPPDFPTGIDLYRQAYRNWSGEIAVDDVWNCAPRAAAQVVTIANWALEQGYRVRAQGMRHGWSPLTLPLDGDCERLVLVDTTQHLTAMRLNDGEPSSVTVEAGAQMEVLLGFLQNAGFGVTACPAPGDITVGGALAIGGHGAAIPTVGETRKPGHTFGSLSNLVLSLTAVVWSAATGRFELRTFDRSDPACAALLVHLGRAFVTGVTLQTGANDHLRCVSMVDIPASELFAPPVAGATRTFASFLEQTGRVEAIWFPFTEHPWLKVWSVASEKPVSAREVSSPYNYPFSDNVPEQLAQLADHMVKGNPKATPLFGAMSLEVVRAGLTTTDAHDLWGPSKDLLLYIRPSTLRVTANGYAVLTRRGDIQQVIADFCARYTTMIEQYRARGSYPVNMPLEIRATGLELPSEVDVAGARPPLLSALGPRRDHPEWDVAVWFDVLSFPGTPDANSFYQGLEAWLYGHYAGDRAGVRVEWSKGWGYTEAGAWTDPQVLGGRVPTSFSAGQRGWEEARARLDALDPHRVFSNRFLDRLL